MKAAALAIVLFALTGWSQESNRQTTPPAHPPAATSAGRYQLIPATLDDGTSQRKQTVLLIDTQTGDVWKYQEAFTYTDSDGKKHTVLASFVPVPIGTPAAGQ
jgi:hypothetical protein